MNIIIVCGGRSVEEQISIITAIKVYKSLLSSVEYHPYLVYQDPNDYCFYGGQGVLNIENYIDKKRFIKGEFKKKKGLSFFKQGHKKIYFDLVFPVVHGSNTEDGTMAAYFITQGFKTLTPPISASAIAQDKILFKDLVNSLNIKTARAKSLSFSKYKENDFDMKSFINELTFPLIIKPYDLGSSIGIELANSFDELKPALEKAFVNSSYVLIEEYFTQKEEINIAVIKDNQNKYHFSELERIIKDDDKIYSYEDKYTGGKTKKDCPYNASDEELNTIKDIVVTLYEKLKLSGVVRYDFIKSGDEIYINELNTIPGNYSINLFSPKGYSIKSLIDIYIESRLNFIQSLSKPLPNKNKVNDLVDSNKFKL